MKLHELFSNTELTELKMSPSSLRTQALNIKGALVGLEFEMYVPGIGSVKHANPDEIEHDYSVDREFETSSWQNFADDIAEFFSSGDLALGSKKYYQDLLKPIYTEYIEWADSEFYIWARSGEFQDWYEEEYPNDNFPSESSSWYNKTMDDFYSIKFDDFVEDNANIKDWTRQKNIDTYASFAHEYDWPWTYSRRSDGLQNLPNVAQSFGQHVGYEVMVSTEYHQREKSTTAYTLEPDGSLDKPQEHDDAGLEFVSPPMPLQDMIQQLQKVKSWARENHAYTNKSCGLHMNISIPGYNLKKLDYLKLALLLGDNYVANQFQRLGNSYAKSSLNKIKIGLRDHPEKISGYLDIMRQGLAQIASKVIHSGVTEKHMTINTKNNRIEFRAPGGDWLNTNMDLLLNSMFRFVVALDAAMDPEKDKKTYYTKLYNLLADTKVFDTAADTLNYFAKFSAGEMHADELKYFLKQAQDKRKAKQSK